MEKEQNHVLCFVFCFFFSFVFFPPGIPKSIVCASYYSNQPQDRSSGFAQMVCGGHLHERQGSACSNFDANAIKKLSKK